MSSSSVGYSAAPWRGAATAARGQMRSSAPVTQPRFGRGPVSVLPGATAILVLWVALWSFFILGVAAPAAQLHRASATAGQPVTAVAKAEPQGDRGR